MTKSKLTLCNESQLLQEEKERLRKLRLIQVREISKQNAALLREEFRKEKQKEINLLLKKQQMAKTQEKEENLKAFEQQLQKQLDDIGQGHLQAAHYDDHSEIKMKRLIENEEKALLRGKVALNNQREEKMSQENKENAHIIARQFALEQEKIRSNQIVKLPVKTTSEETIKIVEKKPVKVVSYHDANAFMTTRYHMPDNVVSKIQSNEMTQDARRQAFDEEARSKLINEDQVRASNERMEKARLRGKHALEKEILSHNYNDILNELDVLQKADREKRQKELMNIPKEIYLPSWQRQQEKNEFQLELERQFEKIYIDSNLRKEEMPMPIDPKQLELSSSNLEDADLDLTLLDPEQPQINAVDQVNNQQPEAANKQLEIVEMDNQNKKLIENEAQANKDDSNASKNQSTSENKALSKLLEKIRKQREDLNKKSTKIIDQESSDVGSSENEDQSSSLSESVPKQSVDTVAPKSPIKSDMPSINQAELIEIIDEDESDVTSESSLQSSESTITKKDGSSNGKVEPSNGNHEAKQQKKIIRGIMMSSHNVSSLNEMYDGNRMLLNAKIISNSHRRAIECDDQSNILSHNNVNTATYSVDLSHASRDPMIAGSKELFNKNDIKLAIEQKQKHLQKQQQDLERKLKELEEQEAKLEKETISTSTNNTSKSEANPSSSNETTSLQANQQLISNANTKSSQSGAIDSGNDHNYCSDSVDNSSIITNTLLSDSNNKLEEIKTNLKDKPLSLEDLKRIQFQQIILNRSANNSSSQDTRFKSSSGIDLNSSSSATMTNSCLFNSAKLIEERKKEILKSFGIESNHFDEVDNRQEIVGANTQLWPTSNSIDSGICLSSRHNNLTNMNLRSYQLDQEKTINSLTSNSGVQLNSINESLKKKLENQRLQQQQLQQQAQLDMLSYLNGEIDEDEYKRRLSSQSYAANISNLLNKSNNLDKNELTRLFGLEFFDSVNMSDIRDPSIEKLLSLTAFQQKQKQTDSIKQALIQTHQTSKSCHNSSFDSSKSSNDTLNDQDSFNINKNHKNEVSSSGTETDEENDEDISKALIISLLNNRQPKLEDNQQQKNLSLIDLKKQFIQTQLDAVRRQKEQLQLQSFNANTQQSLPPSSLSRSHRLISDCNPHELSTIKEVDTPKSERNLNLKVNSQNRKQLNLSSTSSTSLESVTTMLSESGMQQDLKLPSYAVRSNNSSLTSANSFLCADQPSKEKPSDSSSSSSKTSTSTSTPMTGSSTIQTPYHDPQFLNIDMIRQKQKELFNMSLFDSSITLSSNENSTTNSLMPSPKQKKNPVEYGAMIFNSLSSNNLSLSAMTPSMSSVNSNTAKAQQKVAFKTESTNSTLSISNASRINNNSINKKWHDILANDDAEVDDSSSSLDQSNKQLKKFSISMSKSANQLKEDNVNDNGFDQVDNNVTITNDYSNMSDYTTSLTISQHPISKSALNSSSMNSNYKDISSNCSSNSMILLKSSDSRADFDHKTELEDELQKTLQPVNTKAKNNSKPSINNINNTKSQLSMDMQSISTDEIISSTNKSTGLFDKFLKSYTSSASVMDEPELSFVSDRTSNSGRNTPKNTNQNNQSELRDLNRRNSTLSSHTLSSASNNTSDLVSLTNRIDSSNDQSNTSNENVSLVRFQQKQLNKQFAGVSPIEQTSENRKKFNPQFLNSFSNTISFENSTTLDTNHENKMSSINKMRIAENENEDEDDAKSTKSSLILLSPNKIYNEKSCSLIQGLIEDENDDDEYDANSLIEGPLTAQLDYTSYNQLVFKSYAQKTQKDMNDSLVSFENHEQSQLTATVNSTDQTSNFFTMLTAEHTNNISKLFDTFKYKLNDMETSKQEKTTFNNGKPFKKSHLYNSTPMMSFKSYQSSITHVTNDNQEDLCSPKNLRNHFDKPSANTTLSSESSFNHFAPSSHINSNQHDETLESLVSSNFFKLFK